MFLTKGEELLFKMRRVALCGSRGGSTNPEVPVSTGSSQDLACLDYLAVRVLQRVRSKAQRPVRHRPVTSIATVGRQPVGSPAIDSEEG